MGNHAEQAAIVGNDRLYPRGYRAAAGGWSLRRAVNATGRWLWAGCCLLGSSVVFVGPVDLFGPADPVGPVDPFGPVGMPGYRPEAADPDPWERAMALHLRRP